MYFFLSNINMLYLKTYKIYTTVSIVYYVYAILLQL